VLKRTMHFGTVGAPRSTPAKPGGSVGAVQRLAELGLTAFELGWVQSVRVREDTCLAIREAAAQAGVHISVHAPYYINLNAGDDEWPKSRKRLMDAADPGLESQMALEGRTIAAQALHPHGQEGVAAFIGKRKANFA